MWPIERTQTIHKNMAFYPIEEGTLGATSPKVKGVEIIPRYTSIKTLKESHQGMWQLERTQEYNATDAVA